MPWRFSLCLCVLPNHDGFHPHHPQLMHVLHTYTQGPFSCCWAWGCPGKAIKPWLPLLQSVSFALPQPFLHTPPHNTPHHTQAGPPPCTPTTTKAGRRIPLPNTRPTRRTTRVFTAPIRRRLPHPFHMGSPTTSSRRRRSTYTTPTPPPLPWPAPACRRPGRTSAIPAGSAGCTG